MSKHRPTMSKHRPNVQPSTPTATSSTKVGGAAGPGTVDPTGKKAPKGKRVTHPLVSSKDVAVYPLKSLPADFSFAKHKLLKKRDFEADHLFFSYKAAEATAKAKEFEEKATLAKKLGTTKERGKVRRLQRMQEKMAELKKQLTEQGVDVESLLAEADAEK